MLPVSERRMGRSSQCNNNGWQGIAMQHDALHISVQGIRSDAVLVCMQGEFMPPSTPVRAVLLVAFVLTAGCSESPQKQAAAPPPPAVTVAKPAKRTVVDQDEYVGRFVAIDSVEVRARVSGYLDQIHFTDGQLVKQGDLLFTVDKRPFQTSLDQAKANLAQSRANLSFAEADLARGA